MVGRKAGFLPFDGTVYHVMCEIKFSGFDLRYSAVSQYMDGLASKPFATVVPVEIMCEWIIARDDLSLCRTVLSTQLPFLDQCVKRGNDDQRQQGG
jgi:hypothetical protein